MKNILNLVIAVLMMAFTALGAKAQFNDAAIFRMAGTVNNQVNYLVGTVAEEHIKEADLDPLKGSLEARKRFLDSYTSTQVLDGKITFYRPNGRLIEKDTTLTARVLNVRKLKGSSRYDGVVAVLYGFDPSFSDPAPYVVVGYEEKAAAQTAPQGGGQGAQGAQDGQQAAGTTGNQQVDQEQATGTAKVGGLTPGQFLTDPNSGTTYVVIADQAGNPSLVPVNTMVPAGMQATAQTASQGGGQSAQGAQGGQQAAGTTGNDPNDPSFWYREEHSLDGSVVRFQRDPNTLAWVRVQDPNHKSIEKMDVKPNDVLVNHQTGEIQLLDRRRERLRTNRGFGVGTDPYEDHLPTTASAATARFSNGNTPMGWFNGQFVGSPGAGYWLQGQNWVCGGVRGQVSQQVLINGGYAPGAQQVPRYGPYWRNPGARY